jgi:hypothetical protein
MPVEPVGDTELNPAMPETTQNETQTQAPTRTIDADDVCIAVVEAVSEATETDPNELPPLYESVDPDSLSSLFEQPNVPRRRTGKVLFEMAGCTVTVSSDGEISVREDTDQLAGVHTEQSPDAA